MQDTGSLRSQSAYALTARSTNKLQLEAAVGIPFIERHPFPDRGQTLAFRSGTLAFELASMHHACMAAVASMQGHALVHGSRGLYECLSGCGEAKVNFASPYGLLNCPARANHNVRATCLPGHAMRQFDVQQG